MRQANRLCVSSIAISTHTQRDRERTDTNGQVKVITNPRITRGIFFHRYQISEHLIMVKEKEVT